MREVRYTSTKPHFANSWVRKPLKYTPLSVYVRDAFRISTWSPQLPTLARQISNCSFKNKPKTSPIFFFDDILSSILFIINYLLPVNEPATYYTETTLLSILQKLANCNKTHLQSPVSRIGLERWKRRKTQELQSGAVT